MELNREQTIKALECCSSRDDNACDTCPLDNLDSIDCKRILFALALSLIKELAEENERLSACVMSKEEVMDIANEAIKQCTSIIKADTVRKMQERLKERNKVYCVNESDLKEMKFVVDQIAKELLENPENA